MRLPSSSLLVLFMVAAPAAAAAGTTMVLPVVGQGLLPPVADDIEDGIRKALAARAVVLQSHDATHALLADAFSGGLTCNLGDVSCAARVGAIGDAEHVIFAQMTSEKTMTLADVDVAAQRVAAFSAATVVPPSKDGGASVAALVERVHKPRALLTVDVGPPGANLFLDDVAVGTAPLIGDLAADAGRHAVRAELGGYEPHVENVDVTGPYHVVIELQKAAAPAAPAKTGDPSLAVYVGGGLAGVGALAALGCGIGAALIELQLESGVRGDDTSTQTAGLGLLGGAAVGVLAVAVGSTLVAVGLSD